MADQAWRAQFLHLLLQVHGQCDGVVGFLAAAQQDLALMQIGGAAGESANFNVVQHNIEKASTSLSQSISLMGTADILALRGCADDPSVQPPSAHDIGDNHNAIRLAMVSLPDAKEHAEVALRYTVRCFSRLWAIPFMLRFPGVNGFIETQHHVAANEFQDALERAQQTVPLLAAAAIAATTSGAN